MAAPPSPQYARRFNPRRFAVMLLLYALLVVFAVVAVGPFLWLLSTSLKSGQDILSYPPKLLPNPLSFESYVDVWRAQNMPRFLLNTTLITFWGVLANLALSATAGYALARIRFPGRDIVFFLIVSTLVLPNTLNIVVNFITLVELNLVNTFTGVVLPNAITVFNVFLLRQAFLTIPRELEDAARMDGANEFVLWWRVMLPLVKPALLTVTILEFVAMWNLYQWPLIVLNDTDKFPLSVAIARLTVGELSLDFGNIAAATVISMIPVILIFLVLQRYFIEGLAGSVKG
ncbi:MAG: N-Acetyl-D-glucosamine ABC transport system, permease protein 2 [uncultured Truepera sp.]|uniref:N-Acetyl-D-glucosamine ABC transport system, permease protein 2 n=1 Tax=uncultured Truepera sp. TaxID=543023 RepID=A0A6J4VAG9_9DEIN|nr:MAG: N-Acetyl-D-glucosamine ABC transport system, permease protein 2 [uncultured Truepera sp.]